MWLDREIVAAENKPSFAQTESLTEKSSARSASSSLPSTIDIDALLARAKAEEDSAPSKTGCWTVFSLLLLVTIGAAAAAIYLFYR